MKFLYQVYVEPIRVAAFLAPLVIGQVICVLFESRKVPFWVLRESLRILFWGKYYPRVEANYWNNQMSHA